MRYLNILFFLFILCKGFECKAQCVVVKTDTVNAVIIHEYIKLNDYYCVAPVIMIIGKDSFLFKTDSKLNASLIKKHPNLVDQIGNSCTYLYDEFYDALNYIFKHNLSFSEFNYLKNPYLYSTSLYTKKYDDKRYYSVYNFCGVVNFYKEAKLETELSDKINCETDCPCVNIQGLKAKSSYFVVLKETLKLTCLSNSQETELSICKSDLQKLKILICE